MVFIKLRELREDSMTVMVFLVVDGAHFFQKSGPCHAWKVQATPWRASDWTPQVRSLPPPSPLPVHVRGLQNGLPAPAAGNYEIPTGLPLSL